MLTRAVGKAVKCSGIARRIFYSEFSLLPASLMRGEQ